MGKERGTSLEALRMRYRGAVTYTSGDSAALNAEILALMRQGRKTATCAAWETFGPDGETLPEPGRVDIALRWGGKPALAVRTLRVERVRFCDMDAAMIPPQGEFRDLAHWRAGYQAYFTRMGLFHPEMDLMVETFEVVEDLEQ
ncbi:MAG: ASCH domain-containing protein [Roseobacter sp.]|nr:ASCH domain-containing protein [Roseobacter sp.]